MSEIKVSQMPEANNINDNDLLMIIQGGYNKKIPKELLEIPTKEHQVNVSTEVDTSYKVNLLKTKNLFDKNNVLNGMGIASGGTITSATDNGLFYIPVIVGKTYVFSFTDNGVSGNIVWGYTSQTPANGVSCTYNIMTNANLNGATFTPTETQKYLCLRLNTTANNQYNAMSNIQVEEGSTATPYTPFIPNQINIDNEKYSDTINVGATEDSRSRINVLHSRNLFNKNSAPVLQVYVDNSQVGDSTNARTTYIACKTNTTYTIQKRNDGTYNRFVVATTTTIPANGVAIAQYINNNNASSITITTNSTAKYLVIQFYHINETIYTEQQALDSIMISESSIPLSYEPYVTPSIAVNGDNILKIRNGKGTFTHSSINYGSVFYNVFQNLVIITIQDLQCSSNITSSGDRVKIGTGLPKNADTLANAQFGVITNYNNGSTTYTSRVIVDENGDLYLNYSGLQTSQRYYGTFVYLTTD